MEKLTILWTTDNELTIKNMLFMYAKNAKIQRWYSDVKIILWGASSKKLADNIEIQTDMTSDMKEGVKEVACLACSENLGITSIIQDLGIEVKYVGEDLSTVLKSGERVLSI